MLLGPNAEARLVQMSDDLQLLLYHSICDCIHAEVVAF